MSRCRASCFAGGMPGSRAFGTGGVGQSGKFSLQPQYFPCDFSLALLGFRVHTRFGEALRDVHQQSFLPVYRLLQCDMTLRIVVAVHNHIQLAGLFDNFDNQPRACTNLVSQRGENHAGGDLTVNRPP